MKVNTATVFPAAASYAYVLFVRTPIQSAPDVSIILQNLWRAGWRVVSHTESSKEYSFVLEARYYPESR